MAAYQIQVTDSGDVLFEGEGADIDRLEAVVQWHARREKASTSILVREEEDYLAGCYRVEVELAVPADASGFVCSLDREFRASGAFQCFRRWVKGNTWGWLIRHMPGEQWLHPTRSAP